MKRLIPVFVLFLMFIVFPLGSYLYLSKGVDYRLAALEMVTPKGELIDFEYYVDGVSLSSRSLEKKTALIHVNEKSQDSKYLDMIFDQFKQSPNLELLQIVSDSLVKSEDGFAKVYSPSFNAIMDAYNGKDIILIDTALQVRSYYALNDSTINDLVRDIAVILPLKKKSSIKMTDR